MSKPKDLDRRDFLAASVAATSSLALAGCKEDPSPPGNGTRLRIRLTFEQAVAQLCFALGGWRVQSEAADFSKRFLATERAQRLSEHAGTLRDLAPRIVSSKPLDEIDLSTLSSPERAALAAFAESIWNVREVRFAHSETPLPGDCIADPLWHTRQPG